MDPRRRREGDARVADEPAFFRMDLLLFKTASMLGECWGLADRAPVPGSVPAACGGRNRRSWKTGALLVAEDEDEDGRTSELGLDWGK